MLSAATVGGFGRSGECNEITFLIDSRLKWLGVVVEVVGVVSKVVNRVVVVTGREVDGVDVVEVMVVENGFALDVVVKDEVGVFVEATVVDILGLSEVVVKTGLI